MKELKIFLFSLIPLSFPTVIAFRRVKNSPLIIGIADRIKINHSKAANSIQHVRAVPYFLQIARFDIFYACVVYFGGDRSGIDKSSSATCLLYNDLEKAKILY